MKYGRIEGVSQQVSRIFLGTASPPFNTGGDGSELLEASLALGINAVDTARVYGLSEHSLGKWLEKPGNRERVVLLSKCGHPSEDGTRRVNAREMRRDLETSLEALRTDRLDIYLLHRDDPEIPVGEIMETFEAMREEGRILAFGGSNWTAARIREANRYAAEHGLHPMTVSSPQFGLANQVQDPWGGNCVCISGKAGEDDRAWYRENGTAVVAYSSLGRGLMSGRIRSGDPDGAKRILDGFARKGFLYPENLERLRRCEELAIRKGAAVPQIALSWIFHQELNAFAVVSTSGTARLQQNAEALEISLSDGEASWLDLRQKEGKDKTSMEEKLQGLFREYDEAVQELQKKRKLFDGVLGIGNHPGNAPCHDRLDQEVKALCLEAGEQGTPEEAALLTEKICHAGKNWEGPEYARLMLIAIQRHTLPLIPRMDEAARQRLREWYEKAYPRRNRLPMQDQLLKALQK